MTHRRKTLIAQPSSKKIRQRPDWDDDDLYNNSIVNEDFEADFLSEYGSTLNSQIETTKSNKTNKTTQLISNNLSWGLRDVNIERSLQISPPIINFGSVQRGAVSRKTIRIHNCTGKIARARIVPFKAFSLLEEEENFLKSEPNVARMSAGLSKYITITCVGRGIGTFRDILQVFVSEHELMYEIPIIGEVLAEQGFTEACRRQELAKKMKELEIDLLETTHDGKSMHQLIPSSQLTLDGGEDEDDDDERIEQKKKKNAKNKVSIGGLVAGYQNQDPLEVTNAEVPTFPNVRWNTFTNSLRVDNRKKWKIEPDTSVSVDVIKQRYTKMVKKSKSKWANIEDRFHVAKMLSRVSGLTPRTNVFAAARKINSAANIAFRTEPDVVDNAVMVTEGISKSYATPRDKTSDRNGQEHTVNMSVADRKKADAATENKLLGLLGIEKEKENPEE